MRILLIGAQGQLGRELLPQLEKLGELHATDRSMLDLANPDAIRLTVQNVRPQLIINAAAYTAVDRAEAESGPAMAINGIAPGILAEEAARLEAPLVHYSTDYVFDGAKPAPYLETDPAAPLNTYGHSKWMGERAILATGAPALIFRTSWVYSLHGQNFLTTMLRLGQERETLRVVDDQRGAPTWTRSIAQATLRIVEQAQESGRFVRHFQDHHGLYHMTNGGETTWFGFARAIFDLRPECTARLLPIPSSEYPTPARRPANSLLDNGKLAGRLGIALPHWKDALEKCLSETS
jgi:dTDP-4-dehydrorhamnose reductase